MLQNLWKIESREMRLLGVEASTLILYNECLRYAEEDSTDVSLAYANRSACLYHLKMFKECLIDIRLAKEAGYPEHLMQKLNQREANCLKQIEDVTQPDDFGLKLSFDPDDKLPCMANVLEIHRDENGDLSMIAKEDIDVGKTVAVEKAYSTYQYTMPGWRCNICLKQNANLVPCNNCNVAMFCHGGCQHNLIHQYECGLNFSGYSQLNGFIMNEVRLVLMTLNMFSNVDELKDFVEGSINSDPMAIPNTLSDAKSKYQAFLKLPFNLLPTVLMENSIFYSYCIYKILLNIPKVNAMFSGEINRRFLMHLIGHHKRISDCNSIRITGGYDKRLNHTALCVCSHIGLIKRYFSPSCAPNVMCADRDGHSVYITLRPVKKGEKLTIMLLNCLLESESKRQQMLRESFNFACKCTRCGGLRASPQQRLQMVSDPVYLHIMADFDTNIDNDEKIRELLDKCIAFSRRYGRVPWCKEIGMVMNIHMKLLYLRLFGNIHVSLNMHLE